MLSQGHASYTKEQLLSIGKPLPKPPREQHCCGLSVSSPPASFVAAGKIGQAVMRVCWEPCCPEQPTGRRAAGARFGRGGIGPAEYQRLPLRLARQVTLAQPNKALASLHGVLSSRSAMQDMPPEQTGPCFLGG